MPIKVEADVSPHSLTRRAEKKEVSRAHAYLPVRAERRFHAVLDRA